MKKTKNKGFMLVETLIVTTFVSGVLIFLFIQFTNLNKNYNHSYKYNTIEDLFALEDIKNYIESDTVAHTHIVDNITEGKYEDISNCAIFTNKDYCKRLFELENIKKVIVSTNSLDYNIFSTNYDEEFVNFVKKVKSEGSEKYRLLVIFNDSTFATIRF